MLKQRQRRKELEASARPEARARSTVVSLAVHGLILAALWQVLQFDRVVLLLGGSRQAETAGERLRYLALAPRTSPAPVAAARPSTPRLVQQRPTSPPSAPAPAAVAGTPAPSAPLVAPSEVASTLPPVPAGPVVDTKGPGGGPLASGRGALKGVQPGFTEPRIWVAGEPVVADALEGEAKLDSAVGARVASYRDSVALNTYVPNKYERGDWTYTTKDGKKFGVDKQFIRLGKVAIPTALLGFLPMNKLQGNVAAIEKEARFNAMRVEIIENAQRAMNEEEFRRTVKAIRARKEKERKELDKKRAAEPKVVSER